MNKTVLSFIICFFSLLSLFSSSDGFNASAHNTQFAATPSRNRPSLAGIVEEIDPCLPLVAEAKEVGPGTKEVAVAFGFQIHEVIPGTNRPCPRAQGWYFTLTWPKVSETQPLEKALSMTPKMADVDLERSGPLLLDRPYFIPLNLDKPNIFSRLQQRPGLRLSNDGFYILIAIAPPHLCLEYQVQVSLWIWGHYSGNDGFLHAIESKWTHTVRVHL